MFNGDIVAIAKSEFERSAALRAEFIDLPTYTAYRKAVAEGRVYVLGIHQPAAKGGTLRNGDLVAAAGMGNVLTDRSELPAGGTKTGEKPAVLPPSGDLNEVAKAEWHGSEAIRAEFVDLETYTAWRKADLKGLTRQFNANQGR